MKDLESCAVASSKMTASELDEPSLTLRRGLTEARPICCLLLSLISYEEFCGQGCFLEGFAVLLSSTSLEQAIAIAVFRKPFATDLEASQSWPTWRAQNCDWMLGLATPADDARSHLLFGRK